MSLQVVKYADEEGLEEGRCVFCVLYAVCCGLCVGEYVGCSNVKLYACVGGGEEERRRGWTTGSRIDGEKKRGGGG